MPGSLQFENSDSVIKMAQQTLTKLQIAIANLVLQFYFILCYFITKPGKPIVKEYIVCLCASFGYCACCDDVTLVRLHAIFQFCLHEKQNMAWYQTKFKSKMSDVEPK